MRAPIFFAKQILQSLGGYGAGSNQPRGLLTVRDASLTLPDTSFENVDAVMVPTTPNRLRKRSI